MYTHACMTKQSDRCCTANSFEQTDINSAATVDVNNSF